MTDIIEGGLICESLYAADGSVRVGGLVREMLRSTGTSGATYLAFDGLVREALISGAAPAAAQARAVIMA